MLDKIKGVQTVKNLKITNKTGTNTGYSGYAYDIESATSENVIYPSLDPSIFEIRYPNDDIKGQVVVRNKSIEGNVLTIDTSNLSNGLYLVRVKSLDKIIMGVKKFVK